MGTPPRRPMLVAVVAVLLVVVVAVGLWVSPLVAIVADEYWRTRDYPRQFSTAAWSTQPDRRQFMAQDLVARRLLIGKTRSEARRMLGDPIDPTTQSVQEPDTWDCGTEVGLMPIDSQMLDVWYTPAGRVREADIYTD